MLLFFKQAAESLLSLSKESVDPSTFRGKAEEYIRRAEDLRNLQSKDNLLGSHKSGVQLNIEKAEFLLYQAFEEDGDGNVEEAVDLYTQAIELCLKTVQHFVLL